MKNGNDLWDHHHSCFTCAIWFFDLHGLDDFYMTKNFYLAHKETKTRGKRIG